MKSDLPCTLMKDILPIYNDAATSPESNEMIEDHLKDCRECSDYLNRIRESSHKLLDKEDETHRYVIIGRRIKKRKKIIAITVILLFIFALVFLYSTFCPVLVSGDCMSPTMSDGQVVCLNRLAYMVTTPKRLDVIAYRQSGSMESGRIIAFANEVVTITDGTIYVNGAAIAYPDLPKSFSLNAFTVNKGEYFIIKDNTDNLSSVPQFAQTNSIIGKFHVKG